LSKVERDWDAEHRRSIFGRIEEKVRHKTPLRERIEHAIFRLKVQLEKLEQTTSKLQQRDKEMFQRCVGAQAGHDTEHAAMYANECVEIRKMATTMISSQMAIEQVVLRLQTIEEFGEVLVQMAPIMGIVRETRGRLEGVIPEVAGELGNINSLLNDTLVETGAVAPTGPEIETSSEEARMILDEATTLAEQRMKDRFPELPQVAPISVKVRELEPAVGAPEPVRLEPLTDRVLGYAREHGGHIDVAACASFLGVSKEDVRSAIKQLREEDRIRTD